MVLLTVTSNEKLRLISYPLCFAVLPVLLMIIVTLNYLLTDTVMEPKGAIIFYGVCLVQLFVRSLRILVLDKMKNKATLKYYSVLGCRNFKFSLDEVKSLDMSYGRGSGFARGGALILELAACRYQISDSDICLGHESRVLNIKKRLLHWIA